MNIDQLEVALRPYVGWVCIDKRNSFSQLLLYADNGERKLVVLNLHTSCTRPLLSTDDHIYKSFIENDPNYVTGKLSYIDNTIIPGPAKIMRALMSGDIIKETAGPNIYLVCGPISHHLKGTPDFKLNLVDLRNPKFLLVAYPDQTVKTFITTKVCLEAKR